MARNNIGPPDRWRDELVNFLVKRDYTQRQLAHQWGIDETMLSHYLAGRKGISGDTKIKFMRRFGLDRYNEIWNDNITIGGKANDGN